MDKEWWRVVLYVPRFEGAEGRARSWRGLRNRSHGLWQRDSDNPCDLEMRKPQRISCPSLSWVFWSSEGLLIASTHLSERAKGLVNAIHMGQQLPGREQDAAVLKGKWTTSSTTSPTKLTCSWDKNTFFPEFFLFLFFLGEKEKKGARKRREKEWGERAVGWRETFQNFWCKTELLKWNSSQSFVNLFCSFFKHMPWVHTTALSSAPV